MTSASSYCTGPVVSGEAPGIRYFVEKHDSYRLLTFCTAHGLGLNTKDLPTHY